MRLFFLLLGLGLFSCLSWGQDFLKIAAHAEVAPFAPLMQKMVKEAGIDSSVDIYPIERSFQMVQTGEVDGEFTRVGEVIDKMKNCSRVNVPLYSSDIYPYSFRRDPFIHSQKDIAKYTFGFLLREKMGEYIKTKFKISKTYSPPSNESLLAMLKEARIDYVAITEATALMLEKKYKVKLIRQPYKIYTASFYFVINDKKKYLIPRLEKTFRHWQESGKLSSSISEIIASFAKIQKNGKKNI